VVGCRLTAWANVVAVGFVLYAPVVLGLCGICPALEGIVVIVCAPYILCNLLDAGHYSLRI